MALGQARTGPIGALTKREELQNFASVLTAESRLGAVTGRWFRMQDGYLLLATGDLKYFRMALNCARSIRHFEGYKRPLQLIVDDLGKLDHKLRSIVDYVDLLPPDPMLPATLNKLRLWEVARFERTLFIDADCLLMQPGIERHWQALRSRDFAIPGRKLSAGTWYQTDIAALTQAAAVPYLVQINSGAIYFTNSQAGFAPFLLAREMLAKLGGAVRQRHITGALGDEPFLGLALGKLGHEPYPLNAPGAGWLMLSTIGGSEFSFDVTSGACRFRKHGEMVSPHIVHFVGLQPRAEYDALCDGLTAAWPPIPITGEAYAEAPRL